MPPAYLGDVDACLALERIHSLDAGLGCPSSANHRTTYRPTKQIRQTDEGAYYCCHARKANTEPKHEENPASSPSRFLRADKHASRNRSPLNGAHLCTLSL